MKLLFCFYFTVNTHKLFPGSLVKRVVGNLIKYPWGNQIKFGTLPFNDWIFL